MENYRDTLLQLSEAGARYALIGTCALKAYFPDLFQDYALQDCDVLIDPDPANIECVVGVLIEIGWQVHAWRMPVRLPLKIAEIEGKIYLRATLYEGVLDMTFECPYIPWPEVAAQTHWREGLAYATLNHVLLLKQIKGSPKDLETLALLEGQIPR